jgi:hypothetical protein
MADHATSVFEARGSSDGSDANQARASAFAISVLPPTLTALSKPRLINSYVNVRPTLAQAQKAVMVKAPSSFVISIHPQPSKT